MTHSNETDEPVRPRVEHVTIHAHLRAILDERDANYRARESALHHLMQEIDNRHQQRFDAQTKAIEAALSAQREMTAAQMLASEKAVSKAEAANEKRFESVNEFRGQLNDQAQTFMPRAEADQRFKALAEKVDFLKDLASASAGRGAGMTASWGYLLGAVGLAGAVVSLIIGTR